MITDTFLEQFNGYIEGVVSGNIVAGKLVRAACERHQRDIARQSTPEFPYHFDVARARKACSFYPRILRHSIGRYAGMPFELEPWQIFCEGSLFGWLRDADGTRRFRTSYESKGRKNGKALAIDTVIPVVGGFKTMGDIATDDFVFSPEGEPIKVLAVTEVMLGQECFEIEFSSGEVVVCDADHEWRTTARTVNVNSGVGNWDRTARKSHTDIRTAKEISGSVISGSRGDRNHSVNVMSWPAFNNPASLELDPYILGVWLGDGSTHEPHFTCAYRDNEIVENVRRCKDATGKYTATETKTSNAGSGRYTIRTANGKTIRRQLRTLGVLGDKHIPAAYLSAGYEQRLALLCGLMDTDGFVSKAGQCEYTTINERLANDVKTLCCSLGLKASILTHRATLNGKDVSAKYRVCFFTYGGMVPFRLTRKIARCKDRDARSRTRQIVRCEPCKSVAVKCIEVEGGMYCCTQSFIPTHNSTRIAGRALLMARYDHNPVAAAKVGASFLPEPVSQVVLCATKREQADKVLYAEIERMRRKSPSILNGSRDSNKHIKFFDNDGEIMTVGSDKPYDGLNPHFVAMDEIHAWKEYHREFYDTMITGSGYRDQPLVSYVTTAGSDKSELWKEIYNYAKGVVLGTIEDESYFAYIAELDEDDDPLDESVWIKANPNLGVSVSMDYLREQAKKAATSKVALNRFVRYHGNRQVSAIESAFDLEEWDACRGELSDWQDADAIGGGVDLGGRDDLAAYAFVARFPDGETTDDDGNTVAVWRYEAKIAAYIADNSKRDLTAQPFAGWIYDGRLTRCKNPISQLTADFSEESADLGCGTIAYDPYSAQQFAESMQAEGILPVRMSQNPSMFNEPIHDLLEAIKAGRFRHDGNPLLRWCISNATLIENSKLQVMYDKASSSDKIDPVVAMTMAFRIACLAPSSPSGSLYL